MSAYYAVDGWDAVTVDVSDPGHGRVLVVLDDSADAPREFVLAGRALGRALQEVTRVALDQDQPHWPQNVAGLFPMLPRQARQLLPVLQEATLYAAAGTERAERLLDDPYPGDEHTSAELPAEPLCQCCGEGSPYVAGTAAQAIEWCAEYGHTPFGERQGVRWDTAVSRHRREVEWQRRLEEIRLPLTALPERR